MSKGGASLLVVDDDIETVRILQRTLTAHGYKVFIASNGEEALTMYAQQRLDLVLLELNLPGMSGLEVCARIREESTLPLLVLSVKDNEKDKVEALNLGADDYIPKPFGLNEVLARIHAALRRATYEHAGEGTLIHIGPLLVNLAVRRVFVNGREVSLTPKEYDLLYVFITQRNTILTRQMLLKQVWKTDEDTKSHSLNVHIAQLRRKIEPDQEHYNFIHTIPGIGYHFMYGICESGCEPGADEHDSRKIE